MNDFDQFFKYIFVLIVGRGKKVGKGATREVDKLPDFEEYVENGVTKQKLRNKSILMENYEMKILDEK